MEIKRLVCLSCGKGVRGRYPPPSGLCRRCRLAVIGVVTESVGEKLASEREDGWGEAPVETPPLEPFESGPARKVGP